MCGEQTADAPYVNVCSEHVSVETVHHFHTSTSRSDMQSANIITVLVLKLQHFPSVWRLQLIQWGGPLSCSLSLHISCPSPSFLLRLLHNYANGRCHSHWWLRLCWETDYYYSTSVRSGTLDVNAETLHSEW